MNPIYRHLFVNAFLANGAISKTTGNINGNSTYFYYTRTFCPGWECIPPQIVSELHPASRGRILR